MNSLDSYGNTLTTHRAPLFERTYCDMCNDTLLRHVRHQQLCWFCPTCRHDTSHTQSFQASRPLKAALTRKLNVVKSRLVTVKQTAKQTAKQSVQQSVKHAAKATATSTTLTKTEPTAPAA